MSKQKDNDRAKDKPAVTLPGTVEKIIPGITPSMPEKVQIGVEGAETLYREIRVENKLHDAEGKPVHMKKGAHVEITIETEEDATEVKK